MITNTESGIASKSAIWIVATIAEALGISITGPRLLVGARRRCRVRNGRHIPDPRGDNGQIVSYYDGERSRMRWCLKDWGADSTLQLCAMPSKGKAIISFHHGKLRNGQQREQMHKHWSEALDKLGELLGSRRIG